VIPLPMPPAPEEAREKGLPVTFEDVSRAHFRIRSGIHRTPLVKSKFLSEHCGTEVYLKKDL